MAHSAEKDAGIQRAIRTLLPGLSVARYSERWSPRSPAAQAFDIIAEWAGGDPYTEAENDARDAHVTTEYARSRGMVTVAEVRAVADRWAGVLDECKAADPRWILDRSVTTLDGCWRELCRVLPPEVGDNG